MKEINEKLFWSNVDKKGPKPSEYVLNLYPDLKGTRCWLWRGSLNKSGYGQFAGMLAHRVAYILKFGAAVLLDKKLSVCNKCDVTACVNWKHLFHGSAKMNSV